jgi:hypothetical protein
MSIGYPSLSIRLSLISSQNKVFLFISFIWMASIYLEIFTINEEWWIGQILPKKIK